MVIIDIIQAIFSICITCAAFIYCAIKLSKKDTSRYFVFLNLATGCYAIEEICADVHYFCGNTVYNGFTVSTLGFIGCVLFMLTAMFAVKDKLIKENDKRINKIAFVGPFVILVFMVLVFILSGGTEYKGAAFLIAFILIPFFPASYYSIKHLLLRKQSKVCEMTSKSNLLVLVFLLTNLLFLIVYFYMSMTWINIVSIILSIECALLSLCCLKEDKEWKI